MAAWASKEVDTEPGLSAGFAPCYSSGMRFSYPSLILALACLAAPALAEPLELSRALVLATPPALLENPPSIRLPSLKKGSKGKAVSDLTDLLVRVGLTSFRPETPDVFGSEHDFAVKLLQRHFGLKDDGIAGALLYANLEADLERKNAAVESFAMRLEQLAYQARQEGRRKMIVVNVPSFTLRAIDLETGRTVVETAVVVGRRDRQTPIGRFNVISLKFNPTWSPPPIVIERDILPRLGGTDGKWFEKYRLVGKGPDGSIKPAIEVTREEVEAGWKFLQTSGQDNAMGLLKFETDSKENIYLHDTNERRLFDKPNRMQSSGCIRVQKWAELAAFIAGTGEDKIQENVGKNETFWQKVEKVPVFVEYSLGDVIGTKAVVFPDIYADSGNEPTRKR